MPKPQPTPTSPAWPLGLLLLSGVLVYFPVCGADFVSWDDTGNLVANPDMNPPTLKSVGWYWANAYKDLYIPVTYTIWSALAAVARTHTAAGAAELNSYIFHTANLLAHLASAAMVFLILRRLFHRDWAAFFGAMLFAVHPAQVESVAWISGLKDVLAGMFSLAAMLLYLRATEVKSRISDFRPQTSHVKLEILKSAVADLPSRPYLAATLFFILAMLSKPSAVVVPSLVIVIDLVLLHRPIRRVVVPAAFWLILTIPILIIARRAQHAGALSFHPPLWSRPLIALDTLAFYIRQIFAPIHLAIDYGRSPQWLHSSKQLYFTWIIPAVIGIIALAFRRRWPHFVAGAGVFVLALAPVLGLTDFDFQAYSTTADHYLYLAMLGPSIIFAGLIAAVPGLGWRILTPVCAVLAALAIRANVQARTWQDSQTLFEHTVAVNPDSLAGNVNLGKLYADQAQAYQAAGYKVEALYASDRAIALLERALNRFPNDPQAHFNLGNMYFFRFRFDLAAQHFRTSYELQPNPQTKRNLDEAERMLQLLQKTRSQVR